MIQQTQQGKGPVGVKKTPRKRLAAMGRPATKAHSPRKTLGQALGALAACPISSVAS
jgi:hypothetical protein